MGYIGLYWGNGKENGNHCLGFRVVVSQNKGPPMSYIGLYWGNGTENGNYYLGFRV